MSAFTADQWRELISVFTLAKNAMLPDRDPCGRRVMDQLVYEVNLAAENTLQSSTPPAGDLVERLLFSSHPDARDATAEIERLRNALYGSELATPISARAVLDAEHRGRIAGLREAAEIAHAHTARVSPSQAICELADRLEREDVK